ncbi:MATE family efflux transporter [Anaerotignum sp.]|nr:MATE family efflux transporter [Anaerotignum sp.]MBQ7757686.1 MATE family efflux transporter [Anaerotignum sp.]
MITDLTQGNSRKMLWMFSIPMLLSVIFQQMYNIADSIIAGRFIGEDALAAVGASYPITMIFMAVAVGSNVGCAVVVSRFFGAKQYENVKTAVCTIFLTCIAVSIVMTALGLLLGNRLLTLIQTPENVFANAALYLRIYILGFLFLFLYNICTGIFTSLGDSRTPLYFLIGSSVANIVLDIVFVAVFKMGVAGVAWATFVAQGAASILAFVTLVHRLKQLHTTEPYEKFSASMLSQIALVAIPSVLQQSFVSVGNLFVQSLVNSFGSAVIAGYSAAIKLNTFAVTCFSTLSNGLSSFTAQNIGARKKERIQEGYKAGILLVVIICIPFVLFYFFCSKTAMGLFMDANESQEAIHAGIMFLKIASPFYLIMGIKVMSDGLLRGASAMVYFMTGTFMDLILRVILAYIFAKGLGFGSTGIWMAWPFGWTISMFFSAGFCKLKPWEKKEKSA